PQANSSPSWRLALRVILSLLWARPVSGHEEQVTYAAAEARQHLLAGQFIRLLQDLRLSAGTADCQAAQFRLDQPDQLHARVEVVVDLRCDLAVAVTGGEDLDGQARWHLAVLGVQFGEGVSILVVGDVGAADCIGVTGKNHPGIIGCDVPFALLLGENPEARTEVHGDDTVDCQWRGQIDRLPSHQLEPAVGVLRTLDPVAELLCRHQSGCCLDRAHDLPPAVTSRNAVAPGRAPHERRPLHPTPPALCPSGPRTARTRVRPPSDEVARKAASRPSTRPLPR